MYQISTWSTKYCKRTTEKVWRSKYKKKLVCRVSSFDTRQTCSLPSVRWQALGKVFPLSSVRGDTRQRACHFFKKKCLSSASPPGTRQSGNFVFLNTMECGLGFRLKKKEKSLPSAPICHSANRQPQSFAECQGLALGKEVVCRVPTRWHSANLDGRRRPLPNAIFCRAPKFAECLTLGKMGLCRVYIFVECPIFSPR